MKQERAVVTRGRLTRAAAGEFARHGYAGTSLQVVCKEAEVSMGALTFHFRAKSELAEAVAEAAVAETGAVVAEAKGCGGDPLAAMSGLACDLAGLLARSPAVRAIVRLEEERVITAGGWQAAWEPAVRAMLECARRRNDLTAEIEVETVVQLAAHLLNGTAVTLHARPDTDEVAALAHIWAAVMQGIRASAEVAH
ncbi:TetR family transcriptional regulator [Streptomyces sp. NPDC050315]|uniref:TetR family transcriptional regulator n=1 Tax=Streptomyces sp. NPDC050315 TaxID=3155039 RepID=UPI0034229139